MFRLKYGWCGDEICNCHYIKIYQDKTMIYESSWGDPATQCHDYVEEWREDLLELSQEYGFKIDTTDDYPGDWTIDSVN